MIIAIFIIGCIISFIVGSRVGIKLVALALLDSYEKDPNKALITIAGENYKLVKETK